MLHGEFITFTKEGKEIITCNTVVEQGQKRIFEAVFQNLTVGKPMGTLEIGLIDEIPSYSGLIAALTTEPTSAGGYARQTLTPVVANWTVDSINGEGRVTSATVTFSAVGADFSRTFSRYFLAEQGGEIISYSSPISAAKLLLDGQSQNVAYRMYNR